MHNKAVQEKPAMHLFGEELTKHLSPAALELLSKDFPKGNTVVEMKDHYGNLMMVKSQYLSVLAEETIQHDLLRQRGMHSHNEVMDSFGMTIYYQIEKFAKLINYVVENEVFIHGVFHQPFYIYMGLSLSGRHTYLFGFYAYSDKDIDELKQISLGFVNEGECPTYINRIQIGSKK